MWTRRLSLTVGAALVLAPAAYANVIWPALFVTQRLLSIPVIAIGLLTEVFVLRFVFKASWPKALLAGSCVNAISAVLGLFLIPLAGIGWEFFPGLLLYNAGISSTFSPITWVATYLMVVLINTALEGAALRYLFKIRFTWRTLALWALASAVSAALAFVLAAVKGWTTTEPFFDLWPLD